MKRYWIVQKETQSRFKDRNDELCTYVVHDTRQKAEEEAGRLASVHRDRFVVLESVTAFEPISDITSVPIEDE